MALNRSDTILKYIVEYFIKHAQPVGSQTLIDEYHLPYSSATIRNEMFALEKLGLIEKTHTSSGRAPSAQGYRYYCDHLRDKSVDEDLKYSLQNILAAKIQSIEEVLKSSCEILSQMTSLVSVVMGPDEKEERLANVQLVQISPNTITAVFVTDKGYVENKTFILDKGVDPAEIVACVTLLNDRLKGTPIFQLVEKIKALKPLLNDYIVSHDLVYQALLETFLRFASDRLSLYGREELFNNPEFKNDTDKLQKMFRLLNDNSLLKEMEGNLKSDSDTPVVKIGEVTGNPDLSTITAKVKLGSEGETSITLLGPTRMDYDKALSALEYLTEQLNKYFAQLDDKKGGKDGGDA
ncbi:MAG TPA: heat-inducible transcriptional repressor HrcA [Bacilli bacterium]|nr:heat-inducible transcriptional repressor HrcA [Bacilli bacterium]